jgi:NADPH:quinone reductase-like Zn-dependent oxidoreductase
MKAIVWTKYGPPDVLQLKDVDIPTPRDNEALIKVHAATVTIGDCELRSMKGPTILVLAFRIYVGLMKPKRVTILGQELAGEIESVGKGATKFKKGDTIFAPCLLRLGAYAEYACLPEKYLVIKPASITYEEAATIPTGGINGLDFLRAGDVRVGESILINGAGGSIGTYALQIAKTIGAEVTCVDSAEKLDMLLSIGADHVIDYMKEDFTRKDETYDVIIDVIGKSSFSRRIRLLKPNGRYVLGNPSISARIRVPWTPMTSGKKVIIALASYKDEYYTFLLGLMAEGRIKSIIDRRYPLEQTADAHRFVDAGHKKGNVVITIRHESE